MLCRLCCKECFEFQNLYDEDGQKNNIYKICLKYLFQEMEELDRSLINCSKVICNACWKTINEFNDFCENIVTQQIDYCKLIAASKSLVLPEDDDCFIVEDDEETEPELIENNELLAEDSFKKPKSSNLEDDSQNTDTFTKETTAQKDLVGFDSVTSNCGLIDSVEIEAEESNECNSRLREQEELSKEQNELNDSNFDSSLIHKANRIIKEIIGGQFIPILQCDLCEYSSLSHSRFVSHYKDNHPNNLNSHKFQNPFECEICYGRYESKKTLQEHFYSHRKSIECPQCGKEFRSEKFLETHIKKKVCRQKAVNTGSEESPVAISESCAINDSLLKTKSTDKYGAHLSTEQCLKQYRQDSDCYESNENREKNVDGMESECVVHNEILRESAMDSSKSYGFENDSHNIDSSEMSGLNDFFEIKIKEEVIDDDDGENELSEDDDASQSLSNSLLSELVAEGTAEDSQDQEIRSKGFALNEYQKQRIKEIKSEILNEKWKAIVYCEFCEYSCGTQIMFLKHYKNAHPDKLHSPKVRRPFECEICRRSFTQKNNLKSHYQTHIKFQKVFDCPECDKSFTCRQYLRVHARTMHLQSYNKSVNRRKVNIRKKRIKEIQSEFNNGKWKIIFRCDLCKYTCDTQTMFRNHYKRFHPNNLHSPKFLRPFECEICHRNFSIKRALKVHYFDHIRGERNLECTECEMRFSCREYLNKHIKLKHNEKSKTWASRLYGSDVSPKQSLIPNEESESCKSQHLNQTRDKLKKPQTKENITNHDPVLVEKANKIIKEIIVDTWAPIMHCDFCEYSADISTIFIHYKMAHVNDLISLKFQKPFKCEICHQSLYSQISLTRHMSIHENPDNKCSHCEERFDCKENLDTHMQDKHSKYAQPCWCCDLCGLELTTKYKLADHKARKVCIKAENSTKAESGNTDVIPIEIKPVEPSENYGNLISTEPCLQQHVEDLDCYVSQETQGRDVDDKSAYETLFEGVEPDFILDD